LISSIFIFFFFFSQVNSQLKEAESSSDFSAFAELPPRRVKDGPPNAFTAPQAHQRYPIPAISEVSPSSSAGSPESSSVPEESRANPASRGGFLRKAGNALLTIGKIIENGISGVSGDPVAGTNPSEPQSSFQPDSANIPQQLSNMATSSIQLLQPYGGLSATNAAISGSSMVMTEAQSPGLTKVPSRDIIASGLTEVPPRDISVRGRCLSIKTY
jgi:hypothetical protein